MLPYISYCCAIWGNTHQSKLRKLFLLQKRALRLIANVSYTYHTDSLFKNYKCLKLEDLVKLHINCIMHKAFHSDLPVQLQKLFLKVENKHSYVTRRKDYFYKKSVRTKLKQMSISIFLLFLIEMEVHLPSFPAKFGIFQYFISIMLLKYSFSKYIPVYIMYTYMNCKINYIIYLLISIAYICLLVLVQL